LSWTLPKLNTDGSAATTVATVEIYRLATDRNQPAPDSKSFAQSAHLWKSIPKQVLDTYPQGIKLSSDMFQAPTQRRLSAFAPLCGESRHQQEAECGLSKSFR
jgi:hypothetical protein